ncbi:MAG: type II toxin-antitoxin system RelE/ParE family toxin [Phycisphaerales bacterium]
MTAHAAFTPEAIRDIDSIAEFYAVESPAIAQRFYLSVDATAQLLAENPLIGRLYEPAVPDFEGLRVWGVRSFRAILVLYVPADHGARVMRVYHAKRDQAEVFRRDADE